LHRALVADPGSCIKRLGGGRRKLEMRFTRFLRHDAVSAEAIFAEAGAKTAARVEGRSIIAIQDTSSIALGGRERRAQGFGPVGKGGGQRGVMLHGVLALDAASFEVLGLAGAEVWNRSGGAKVGARAKRLLEEKESHRWVKGAEKAGRVLAKAQRITVVADRESDIYEDFARRPPNVDLLTRSRHDRKLADGGKLYARLDAQELAGEPEVVEIPAKPGQEKRSAKLALRFCEVAIKAPKCGMPQAALKALPASLKLRAVDIREVEAPVGIAPIHWRLITTHQVTSRDQALAMLRLYRARWSIEEYHHTLKRGGFDIENARIGEPQAMMAFTAAVAVAAVTVMQLLKARDNPKGQALATLFEARERKLLAALNADYEGKAPRPRQKNPNPPDSLAYATWIIGRLGGWTGYYDKPGPQTLNRGLQAFYNLNHGANLMRRNM